MAANAKELKEFKRRVSRLNQDARWLERHVRGSEPALKLLKLTPEVRTLCAFSKLVKDSQ